MSLRLVRRPAPQLLEEEEGVQSRSLPSDADSFLQASLLRHLPLSVKQYQLLSAHASTATPNRLNIVVLVMHVDTPPNAVHLIDIRHSSYSSRHPHHDCRHPQTPSVPSHSSALWGLPSVARRTASLVGSGDAPPPPSHAARPLSNLSKEMIDTLARKLTDEIPEGEFSLLCCRGGDGEEEEEGMGEKKEGREEREKEGRRRERESVPTMTPVATAELASESAAAPEPVPVPAPTSPSKLTPEATAIPKPIIMPLPESEDSSFSPSPSAGDSNKEGSDNDNLLPGVRLRNKQARGGN
ncbi:hypothetical protein V5O48_010154 [Marasmius crinis-equi]|uniref:Uncharacterized protein n=1 Tax=Marasmius crinis-equi TaxID=585013 RepID=A0ABR3F961_9AGAR